MNIWRQFAAAVLVLSLLLSVACKKKKPQLPPQAQAPTIAVPIPDEISEAAAPPPAAPKKEEPAPPPAKPKSQPHHHKKTAQPPASNSETSGNSTVAAAHPPPNLAEGAPDTAIAADVSSAQVSQQKQTTADLLAAAEKNLKSVNRKLSHDEQDMVAQIKTYIKQSRKATSDNDFERAYNLATKARLLSDALVKK
ncbi:MAG: hypothetical protein WCC92_15780 [Candidatus Korobacteraceae bacterium]